MATNSNDPERAVLRYKIYQLLDDELLKEINEDIRADLLNLLLQIDGKDKDKNKQPRG